MSVPSQGPSPQPVPPASQPLLIFLGTTAILLTALLVLLRLRPDQFGLARASAEVTPDRPLAPRLSSPTGPAARYAPRPVSPPAPLLERERTTIGIFRDGKPSVVHVTSRTRDTDDPLDVTATEYVQGTGSGFLWDDLGHVVTNAHVVEGSSSAMVTLADGSRWEAELVGIEPSYDLAVIRIAAPGERLVPVRFGSSADLEVGQSVYAIGNPYGLDHSLSTGVISGLGRRIQGRNLQYISEVIQTDAAIHPGSSGGLLLDSGGRMIGMNTAVHREADRQVGVGFAMPVDLVLEVVPAILRGGFEWFPELGMIVASDAETDELLESLRDAAVEQGADWRDRVPESGVIVAEVRSGGAADLAGLRGMLEGHRVDGSKTLIVRDVIVSVEGRPITGREELDKLLFEQSGRASFELEVAGAGGRRVLRVTNP